MKILPAKHINIALLTMKAKELNIEHVQWTKIQIIEPENFKVSSFNGIILSHDSRFSIIAVGKNVPDKVVAIPTPEQLKISKHRIQDKTCVFYQFVSMEDQRIFLATSTEPRIWTPEYGNSVALEHPTKRKQIKFPSLAKVWPKRFYIEGSTNKFHARWKSKSGDI